MPLLGLVSFEDLIGLFGQYWTPGPKTKKTENF